MVHEPGYADTFCALTHLLAVDVTSKGGRRALRVLLQRFAKARAKNKNNKGPAHARLLLLQCTAEPAPALAVALHSVVALAPDSAPAAYVLGWLDAVEALVGAGPPPDGIAADAFFPGQYGAAQAQQTQSQASVEAQAAYCRGSLQQSGSAEATLFTNGRRTEAGLLDAEDLQLLEQHEQRFRVEPVVAVLKVAWLCMGCLKDSELWIVGAQSVVFEGEVLKGTLVAVCVVHTSGYAFSGAEC